MIKAVIFDFGAVLISERRLYINIARALKINRNKAYDLIIPLTKKWSCNKISENEFWRILEKRLKRKIPPDVKKNIWLKPAPNIESSWSISRDLHKHNVRLALLSNVIPPIARINQQSGKYKRLKRLGFEAIVLSCKVGFRKPDPKIYKIVLKKLKLPANNCLFVDDKLENVKAARKLGMKGIRFQTPTKLRKDLSKIGLL